LKKNRIRSRDFAGLNRITYKTHILRTPEEITALFKKYITNQCTAEETQEVLELLCAEEYGPVFKELIDAELQQKVQERIKTSPGVETALAVTKEKIILRLSKSTAANPGFHKSTWFKFTMAAVLLLCAGMAVFFYADKQMALKNEQYLGADIAPGGNKAVLTLADGSKIVLDETVKGNLSNQAGITITKTGDGKLVYTVQEDGHQGGRAKVSRLTNTISTPRGGQYQINLPDGTRVWLNAESVLKFPVSFSKLKERRVELQGEAYFEVAKVMIENPGPKAKELRMPFFVECKRQTIEVMGTHFNVNAYADNKETKTTLLEGAVKVLPMNGPATGPKILKPGQQAKVSQNAHAVRVIQVDPLTEIAWKNGQFFFENEPIEDIMKEIARWYDVEVVYQADVSDKTVWGSVTRYANVSKVLSILELTGEIHFKVEGRRITVQK